MKFYRKVKISDRTPHKKGKYLFEIQGTSEVISIDWNPNQNQKRHKGKVLHYWLEPVDLNNLKFTTSTGSPDFVDGINYILEKLKDQII